MYNSVEGQYANMQGPQQASAYNASYQPSYSSYAAQPAPFSAPVTTDWVSAMANFQHQPSSSLGASNLRHYPQQLPEYGRSQVRFLGLLKVRM